MTRPNILLGALLLTGLLCNGCGILTVHMDTTPALTGGSPLRGIESVSVAVSDFEDETDEILALVSQAPISAIKIDRPASEIVEQAIAAELERNGHMVVTEEDHGITDVRVSGTVTKLLMIEKPQMMGLAGFEYDVYAEMRVAVHQTKRVPQFSKQDL